MRINESLVSDILRLTEEVGLLSDTTMERYSSDLKEIRKIGDLTLKAASKIEGLLDETIIMWVEKVGYKITFNKRLINLRKYQPLLSHIFMSGKVDILAEYGLLKKHKDLYKDIMWLNSNRNDFAHYHVYRYKLEANFSTLESRKKYLTRIKSILIKTSILKKAIESLNDKK